MWYSEARGRLIQSLRAKIHDQRVLEAMEAVPRETFLPPELARQAYEDNALPIGAGQTISQPLMVGTMLEALQVGPSDVVLDIGTGSGYQAALLSRLAARVVSVERVASLAERARETLRGLGYANVEVHPARRELGWPEGAPYDGIIVAAAAPSVPQSLVGQLAEGGRLVLPVGSPFEQNLVRVTKQGAGTDVTWLGPCRFVHLIGDEGWPDDDMPV
ncbi:MAG: protein-L-isoaspartate(D-aspartate) O-methyltransferase [Dehalococcoidia bacterium]